MDSAPDLDGLLEPWRERLGARLEGRIRDGVVWLTGRVADHESRRSIAEAVSALGLPVANGITVACDPPLEDAAVHRYVHAALASDPQVSVETLTVEVGDGVVSLVGEVGSREELARAVDTAAAVCGVRRVVNLLRVAPDAQRRDLRIVREVMDRLCFAPGLDDRLVRVMASEGEVVLLGRVETPQQAEQAARIAGQVEGVKAVRNRLKVAR